MADLVATVENYVRPFLGIARRRGLTYTDVVGAAMVRLLECCKKHVDPPAHTQRAYMRGAILAEIRFWRFGKYSRRDQKHLVLNDTVLDQDTGLTLVDLGVPYHDLRLGDNRVRKRPTPEKKKEQDRRYRKKLAQLRQKREDARDRMRKNRAENRYAVRERERVASRRYRAARKHDPVWQERQRQYQKDYYHRVRKLRRRGDIE